MRCLRDLQSLECTFWNEGDFLDYFKKNSLDKQGLIVLHYSVINHKGKEKKKFLV